MALIITLVVLAVVVFAVIGLYNKLVALGVRSDNAWADIDVQLKRRHDLIPNLVETVKGYASHERETLDSVTAARTRAVAAKDGSPEQRAAAEAELGAALRGLTVAVEAYPELQASGGFRDLQAQLGGIEEALQAARRYYNAVVRELNTRVMQFPSNVVANVFGFRSREFFEAEGVEREVPQVSF